MVTIHKNKVETERIITRLFTDENVYFLIIVKRKQHRKHPLIKSQIVNKLTV